jgi:hypothetical protein
MGFVLVGITTTIVFVVLQHRWDSDIRCGGWQVRLLNFLSTTSWELPIAAVLLAILALIVGTGRRTRAAVTVGIAATSFALISLTLLALEGMGCFESGF